LRDKPGRGFGELLEQHDRQGKVAAREYPTLLFTGEGVDLREIAFRETGGSYHDVCTAVERGQDVGLGGIRSGVLDKDVAGRGECLCGRGVNATGEARLVQHLADDAAGVLARDRSDKGEVRRLRGPARKLGSA
jgi:hypothetical protein